MKIVKFSEKSTGSNSHHTSLFVIGGDNSSPVFTVRFSCMIDESILNATDHYFWIMIPNAQRFLVDV